jgi:6-phosphogluconate dehydrogenase
VIEDRQAMGGERRPQLLPEDAREDPDLPQQLLATGRQLLARRAAVERALDDPFADLTLQPADALHEELVVEHSDDSRELDPLEQRALRLLGQREHAAREGEPAQLATLEDFWCLHRRRDTPVRGAAYQPATEVHVTIRSQHHGPGLGRDGEVAVGPGLTRMGLSPFNARIMKRVTPDSADAGMIGLGVMGRNLALNMADHGSRVAVWNRDFEPAERFVAEHPDTPGGLVACSSLSAFVAALRRPRRIVMLIKAGEPVDEVNRKLAPLLDAGDVIVDGGNSLFSDTIRRERELAAKKILFVGSGVSGGETGARFGPSLMAGGAKSAWRVIGPLWKAIAAKVDARTGKPIDGAAPGRPVGGGEPCAAWIGTDGAGHYVKMVHNGIEYADMQLIAEAYHVLRDVGGMSADELAEVFQRWNEGDLDSFLIEITADILRQRDPRNPRRPFVDAVLDAAGQKGTGKWTSVEALDRGVAAPTIAEAVFARIISAAKEERVAASKQLRGPRAAEHRDGSAALVDGVRDALWASKLCAYAQGFALMAQAQGEFDWKLDFGEIARIWRGGCIIRARFLQKIADAYAREPALPNLLLDPYFKRAVGKAQAGWRRVVARAAEAGIPVPGFASALAYYDAYRAPRLPANLIQAQRDFFGSHTYERADEPRGRSFHLDWPDPERPEKPV